MTMTPSEWTVMECLWADSPRTLMQLVHALEEAAGWSPSTTKTMVARMTAKGYLRYEEGGKARLYTPCLTRSEAAGAETERLLQRAYQGRLGLLVNAMAPRLTQADIAELQAILDKAKKG